jgi:diadenosine tetraphosphatase ApaH/serine/threonine PP2A family protein phosphatase
VSDIDTVVVDSLKVLDPERPIREADIAERNCCTAVGQLWGRGMIRAPPFGTADRPAFLSKINARESDRGLIYIRKRCRFVGGLTPERKKNIGGCHV